MSGPTGSPPPPTPSSASTRPGCRWRRPPPWPARSGRRTGSTPGPARPRSSAAATRCWPTWPRRAGSPTGSWPAPGPSRSPWSRPARRPATALAPHFVELVKREAQTLESLGEDAATRLARLTVGGYRVETTLDPATFEATTEAARGSARPTRRPRGGHRLRRAGHRRHPQPLRRRRVRLPPVRPGQPGGPPARFGVQAVRVPRRPAGRHRSPQHVQRELGPQDQVLRQPARPQRREPQRRADASTSTGRWCSRSMSSSSISGARSASSRCCGRRPTPAFPTEATEAQGAVFLGGLDRGVSALTMAAAYATFAVGWHLRRALRHRPDRRRRRHGWSTSGSPSGGGPSESEEVGVLNRMLQAGRHLGDRPGGGHRAAGGGEDGHLGGQRRRLVRRLRPAAVDGGVGRLRAPPPDVAGPRTGGVGRIIPGGHLRRRHAAGAGGRGPRAHPDGRTRRTRSAPAVEGDHTVPPAGIRRAETCRTTRPQGRGRR